MTIEVGQVISGRYRVDQFLGRGGMAEVYKVWDKERAVHLAMKVLHEDMSHDKVFLRRFQREAQTMAKLQHPYIVRFYGLGQDGGLVYLLMEYVEGKTLKEEIFQAEGPLTHERVVEIMGPVCSALTYAHSKGYVHCDIKPANIMIRKNGDVLLTDFGITRLAEGATATMVGAGTPAYMAPEQILGKDPTPQTDIYALGIVLFEMLTGGERPFTGEQAKTTGSTAEKVRWEQLKLDPPSPSKYNKAISPQVEAVVMRCLEKDPDRRFLSVLDLLKALGLDSAEKLELTSDELDRENADNGKLKRNAIKNRNIAAGTFNNRFSGKIEKKTSHKNKREVKFSYSNKIWSYFLGGFILLILLIIWIVEPKNREAGSITVSPSMVNTNPTITPYTEFEMVFIPSGKFIMGMDVDQVVAVCSDYNDGWCVGIYIDDDPMTEYYLDDYWIDKYEVTNENYQVCVASNACRKPSNLSSETREDYYLNPEYQKYPVIYVDWFDAVDYCAWRGVRLPTEPEWEKAARGTEGDVYPWGNVIADCDRANFKNGSNDCIGDTSRVGAFKAGSSPYGVMDMTGNVMEWVSSSAYDYPYDPNDGREDMAARMARFVRGGAWNSYGTVLRASYRGSSFVQTDSVNYVGFRCARSQ